MKFCTAIALFAASAAAQDATTTSFPGDSMPSMNDTMPSMDDTMTGGDMMVDPQVQQHIMVEHDKLHMAKQMVEMFCEHAG